jgi:putative Mn2+ efflux pump MntP
LVTLRFAAEAMNLAPTTASAWSSSVGLLLSGLYLGGIGPRMGVLSPRQLLAPALVLGWVWRLWNFLAALVSAVLGYETHFFHPSQDRVAFRLLEFLGWEVIVVGFAAGLLVWGIALWASRATRPLAVA